MAKKQKNNKKYGLANAVKHPGAFRKWCKRQGFSKVNTACINKGLQSKNPTTRKRANLALVFKKLREKRNKKK